MAAQLAAALGPRLRNARLFASRLLRLAPLAILVALVLLAFAPLAFTDRILARGDTFSYFYPYWEARGAALAAGRLPLWAPELFAGVPLLANSQIGAFYPPNWPLSGLPAPEAIRLSILIHLVWAALGAYLLARDALGVGRWAALLAAALFAAGGHVGAHIEQINQLQGLAWMPWLFLLLRRAITAPVAGVPLLAIGLALQFFTGHTQTVFITSVGLGIYALCDRRARALPTLAAAAALALLLAAPQLIPTIEMTEVSNRRGGLNPNQATAFSLSPFVLGRGLLPSYDRLIFGEYVAYIGVIGLGLALLGALERASPSIVPPAGPRWARPLPPRWTWSILALTGLLFAFGLYNPLYWALASLPGFNLFRVPARWLALFALGTAMLAALGLERCLNGERPRVPVLISIVAVVSALALGSAFTLRSPDLTPVSLPEPVTIAGWAVALVTLIALLRLRRARPAAGLLLAAALLELLLAARALPANDPTAPEVYYAQRFTASQLLAYAERDAAAGPSQTPDRLLSINDLRFDPGDRAALEARFERLGLSQDAVAAAFTAIKLQETLAPNLPLIYGLPSADGFDGGLLPTAHYTAFTSLLLPAGEPRTIDGRLREVLARPAGCRGACIPEQRWLNLLGVRYLIVDKLYDPWHEGVTYDTTFERVIGPTSTETIAVSPPFEATAVDLLFTCPDAACSSPAATAISLDGAAVDLAPAPPRAQIDGFVLARLPLPAPLLVESLQLRGETPVAAQAVTLVDERTGDFQTTTFAPWERVLSSDIKLYENQAVLPRALVVGAARFVPDDEAGTEAALALMRDPSFDPRQTIVIAGSGEDQTDAAQGHAELRAVSAEQIAVHVEADAPAYLLLLDAYYPGWTATVNGEPAAVLRANVMFRAVAIPAGTSEVIFTYQPQWYPAALIGGAIVWAGVLIAAAALARARRAAPDGRRPAAPRQ